MKTHTKVVLALVFFASIALNGATMHAIAESLSRDKADWYRLGWGAGHSECSATMPTPNKLKGHENGKT